MGSDLWLARNRGVTAEAFDAALASLPSRLDGCVVDRIGPNNATIYLWRLRRIGVALCAARHDDELGDLDPRHSTWVEIDGSTGAWAYVLLFGAHLQELLDTQAFDPQDRCFVTVRAPPLDMLRRAHDVWVQDQKPTLCMQLEQDGGRISAVRIAEAMILLGELRDPPSRHHVYWTDTLELANGAQIGISWFGTLTLRASVDDAAKLKAVAATLTEQLGIQFRPPVHQYELRWPR